MTDSNGNGGGFNPVFPEIMGSERFGWMTSGGGSVGKGPTSRQGYNASKHDVGHHRTLGQILEEDLSCGFGFVVPIGYVVEDYDKAIYPEGHEKAGQVKEHFGEDINKANTYIEYSSSGLGLHVVSESNEHPDTESMKRSYEDGSAVEILGPGCFVKTTGRPYPGKPLEIHNRTIQVRKRLHEMRAAKRAEERAQRAEVNGSVDLSDDEIISLIRNAKNAAKFSDLFDDGALGAYNNDQNRADMALIGMLAFYTRDEDQLDRIFRRSALMRDKWDEKRGRLTYGELTIEKITDDPPEETYSRGTTVATAAEDGEEGLHLGFSERLPIHTYMRDGIQPPKLLIDDVLYAGTTYEDGSKEGVVHTIYGEPGAGKSMIALKHSVQVMRMGANVVYIDEEGTRRMVTERLQGLGATPEEIEEHFFYFNSTALAASNSAHRGQLATIAETVRPDLVIFDSWIDFLATDGRSENSSDEVVGWAQLVSRAFIAVGSTVVLLDHIPKAGSGRGARGSGGKLGWVTAAHKIEVVDPFNRDLTGTIRLLRQKDREGALPNQVNYTIGGDGTGKIICRHDADVIIHRDKDGMTPNMRTLLEALPKGGATFTAWFNSVPISSKDSFTKAKDALVEKGRVTHANKRYTPVDFGPNGTGPNDSADGPETGDIRGPDKGEAAVEGRPESRSISSGPVNGPIGPNTNRTNGPASLLNGPVRSVPKGYGPTDQTDRTKSEDHNGGVGNVSPTLDAIKAKLELLGDDFIPFESRDALAAYLASALHMNVFSVKIAVGQLSGVEKYHE